MTDITDDNVDQHIAEQIDRVRKTPVEQRMQLAARMLESWFAPYGFTLLVFPTSADDVMGEPHIRHINNVGEHGSALILHQALNAYHHKHSMALIAQAPALDDEKRRG